MKETLIGVEKKTLKFPENTYFIDSKGNKTKPLPITIDYTGTWTHYDYTIKEDSINVVNQDKMDEAVDKLFPKIQIIEREV